MAASMLEYDPEERFRSDRHRHYTAVCADALTPAQTGLGR